MTLATTTGWSSPTDPAPSASTPAGASSRLRDVEQTIRQDRRKGDELDRRAGDLRKKLEQLRQEKVSAAKRIREHEAEAQRIEGEIAEIRKSEDKKLSRLREEHKQLGGLMVAMVKLARRPPEALIVQPLTVNDVVRSAALLRTIVPEVHEEAADLRGQLQEIVYEQRQLKVRGDEMAANAAILDQERKRLDALYRQTDAEKRQTETERLKVRKRIAALTREAKDLRDLLRRLTEEEQRRAREQKKLAAIEATPPKPVAVVPMSQLRGRLPIPAIGRIVKRFGEDDGTGIHKKGITIVTQPGAQVVAPVGGKVVFADVFRGYGQLLIIEHSEGYHTLLAGLGRIDVSIGQQVVAGEPVGIMNQSPGSKPALYVELRRDGQPINPLPWLAANIGKVSG